VRVVSGGRKITQSEVKWCDQMAERGSRGRRETSEEEHKLGARRRVAW